ncbi:hypothetical protein PENFLA_c011G00804 [Penicillium flavigenum]|uniref:Uncharacterized protein n=1 Tax=Penicillium flavigenum TaxID=254877 RepID=A0A1V6TBF7_9EURO|nr:hypothetical protein PENFLA_c011G00804 [Penicillium flavigenum]
MAQTITELEDIAPATPSPAMAAIHAKSEGLSATSFNQLAAHVLPEANPAPTLPHALLRGSLPDPERIQRKTVIYQIFSNRPMKVHSVSFNPYQ